MENLFYIVFVILMFSNGLVQGRGHSNRLLCKDELSYRDCKFYREAGYCESHAAALFEKCPVTCDLCDYGTSTKKVCKDLDGIFNCQYLRDNGVCKTHPDLMAERCAKTCNLCDAKEKCAKIQCPKHQVCVLDKYGKAKCECPQYCPYKEQYKKLGKVCASNAKTYKDYCHLQHHACREQKDLRVLFFGKCFNEDVCEDGKQEKTSCALWRKEGLCEKKIYKAIMSKYCKKTCGFCVGKVQDPRSVQNCTHTRFGCCWNGKPAPDPKYGSCKKCVDKYPAFCPKFMHQCNSVYRRNSRFMHESCPLTCGFCMPDKRREVQIQIFNGSGQRLYKTQFKS